MAVYDVMLTPPPIMPAVLRVDDGTVAENTMIISVPAGGEKIIGANMRLSCFPSNYGLLFGIQAFEVAIRV